MSHELIELLSQKDVVYKTSNNPHEILLFCTSGEHEDKNPSLSFNLQKNLFQCWSCGFKGGINKYLVSIGIHTPLNTAKGDIQIKRNIVYEKLEKIRDKQKLITIPDDAIPYKHPYRMIDQETVTKLGCFTTDKYNLKGYLCFPMYHFERLKFIEGRLLNNDDTKSKWTRYPKGLDMLDMLYPLDEFQKNGTAILVEGLLDCLYLRDLGYTNVLCIFGTNGFNLTKAEILKNYGIANIIPLMDGDVAGQRAADRIEFLCKRVKINCQRVELDLNRDPKTYNYQELKHLIGEPLKYDK